MPDLHTTTDLLLWTLGTSGVILAILLALAGCPTDPVERWRAWRARRRLRRGVERLARRDRAAWRRLHRDTRR